MQAEVSSMDSFKDKSRPKVPAEIARQVRQAAGHHCSVCGASSPLELAHIRPWAKTFDHSFDNLVCLCANCHSRADKEKWGERTFRHYKRSPWVEREGKGAREPLDLKARLEITLDMELDAYTPAVENWIRYGLAKFLEVEPDEIQIKKVEEGSVKITLSLPAEAGLKLLDSFEHSNPSLTLLFEDHPITRIREISQVSGRELYRVQILNTFVQLEMFVEQIMALTPDDEELSEPVFGIQLSEPAFGIQSLFMLHIPLEDLELMKGQSKDTRVELEKIRDQHWLVEDLRAQARKLTTEDASYRLEIHSLYIACFKAEVALSVLKSRYMRSYFPRQLLDYRSRELSRWRPSSERYLLPGLQEHMQEIYLRYQEDPKDLTCVALCNQIVESIALANSRKEVDVNCISQINEWDNHVKGCVRCLPRSIDTVAAVYSLEGCSLRELKAQLTGIWIDNQKDGNPSGGGGPGTGKKIDGSDGFFGGELNRRN